MLRQPTGAAVFALVAGGIVAATTIAGATIAEARSAYDGTWSVLIVTQRGTCDRAYRYPVRITNGRVGYAGSADFTVSGRVNNDGAVTVRVSRGNQSANGSGRLRGNSGSGSWRGGECSGTWTAERR